MCRDFKILGCWNDENGKLVAGIPLPRKKRAGLVLYHSPRLTLRGWLAREAFDGFNVVNERFASRGGVVEASGATEGMLRRAVKLCSAEYVRDLSIRIARSIVVWASPNISEPDFN